MRLRVAAGALALALSGCGGAPPSASPERLPFTTSPPAVMQQSPSAPVFPMLRAVVTRVVDGDTVHVRLDDGTSEKVRFIGVDTPESTIRHEPFGSEASAFTKRRLGGAAIYLEKDVEERDRYGRLLAYVWLGRPVDPTAEAQTLMFNAILVESGYAQLLTVPPNVRYAELFRNLQTEARAFERGLWGRI